jgi:hypothetical protein
MTKKIAHSFEIGQPYISTVLDYNEDGTSTEREAIVIDWSVLDAEGSVLESNKYEAQSLEDELTEQMIYDLTGIKLGISAYIKND